MTRAGTAYARKHEEPRSAYELEHPVEEPKIHLDDNGAELDYAAFWATFSPGLKPDEQFMDILPIGLVMDLVHSKGRMVRKSEYVPPKSKLSTVDKLKAKVFGRRQ